MNRYSITSSNSITPSTCVNRDRGENANCQTKERRDTMKSEYSGNYGFAYTDSEIHKKKAIMYNKLFGTGLNYQTPGGNTKSNFTVTLEMIEGSEKIASDMPKSEITKIGKMWRVPTNKSRAEITTAVKEQANCLYNSKNVRVYSDSTCSDDVIDYIVKEEVHIRLAKAAITAMCQPMRNGNPYSCVDSCEKMVFSNFKEDKFQDICQEVYERLHILANANSIILLNEQLVSVCGFVDTIPYIVAMRTVQQFFYSEKQTFSNKMYTNRALLNESSENWLAGAWDIFEYSELKADVESFSEYLKKRFPKYSQFAKEFVYGQILGYTQSEIVKACGISSNSQYPVLKIRELYAEYKNAMPVERTKGEILSEFDAIRGKLTNIQKTQKVVSKYGTITTVPMNNLKMVMPTVEMTEKTGGKSKYDRMLSILESVVETPTGLTSYDRKQLMYDELFGIGGEIDKVAAQKEYVAVNDYTIEYTKSKDFVYMYENGEVVRKYPIFKG